jgi:hypothetical protein
MFNARMEGLEDSPVFRRLLPARRCVVLLDGFFEWRLEGKDKRPYFVKDAAGKPYLPLAGLYDVWVTGEVRTPAAYGGRGGGPAGEMQGDGVQVRVPCPQLAHSVHPSPFPTLHTMPQTHVP